MKKFKLPDFDVKQWGYVVNKKLTRGAFLLCLVLMLTAGFVDGFDVLVGRAWVDCPSDAVAPCLNPYFEEFCFDVDCEPEFIFQGESSRPSWFSRHFNLFVVGILFVAFSLNHLLYNKGRRSKSEI